MSEHHEHLTPATIEDFINAQDTEAAERRVSAAMALAEGCPECWAVVEGWDPPAEALKALTRVNSPSTPSQPAHVLRRAARILVRALRKEVPGVFDMAEVLGAELEADIAATDDRITQAAGELLLAVLLTCYAPDRAPELVRRAVGTLEAAGKKKLAQRTRRTLPKVEELAELALELASGS